MNKYILFSSLILSSSMCFSVCASSFESTQEKLVIEEASSQKSSVSHENLQQAVQTDNKVKQSLKAKLSQLSFFSAQFTQKVMMESGEILQESKGKLALQKPNSLYWETFEPDELYIISQNDEVWFYNPWIDEASVYSVSTATAKTPLLLLTSNDESLWDLYHVTKQATEDASKTRYVISSQDIDSQVKSLTLTFTSTDLGEVLSTFAFLDATGQVSLITLSQFDGIKPPPASLFKFEAPDGISVNDYRQQ
ncbi:MAG: outer membrane lipoprotein chaperone LolA [Colwellia sp.]